MNLSFKLFGRHFKLLLRTHKELDQYVAGITNRCKDGSYCCFLDYDAVPLEWVIEELKLLIDLFPVYHFHVFKTTNGFHAICTNKLSLRDLVELMRDSSTDDAYKWVPLKRARKVWTLRTTEKDGNKPEFLTTVFSTDAHQGAQSKPHNDLLRRLYNIEIPTDFEDAEDEFWSAHYHIASR